MIWRNATAICEKASILTRAQFPPIDGILGFFKSQLFVDLALMPSLFSKQNLLPMNSHVFIQARGARP